MGFTFKLTSKKDERIIIKLYSKGASLENIRKLYGFKSVGPIRRVVTVAGILRPKIIVFNKSEIKDIISSYLDGRGIASLAEVYDVDAAVISRVLRENNVVRRTQLESNRVIAFNKINKPTTYVYSFKDFKCNVRHLTSAVYKHCWYTINKKGFPLGRHLYHIDHKISIHNAYYNLEPINFWQLCHPSNLEVVNSEYNFCKNYKSSITSSKLFTQIAKYNIEYGNPFSQLPVEMLDRYNQLYGDLYETSRS